MAKIHILTDLVANQIAAGEVVERPAAVVKELLENSLDAGATSLELSIRDGGRTYICVEDNGCGMAEDDALLCLERHATSKVQRVEDLMELSSFGFRGEALPSIASVSRFILKTKDKASVGTEIWVDHGQFIHKKVCSIPQGTRIEVHSLFQKLPVRLKFLKKDATEAAHIQDMVRLLAFAHPQVAFKFIQEGRLVFHSPPCPSQAERIKEILGAHYLEDMLELQARQGLKVSGFISKPQTKGCFTRKELSFFVNKRPIESRVLAQAVLEAFQGHLPPGRFPKAILFLEIPSSMVDVNVHPTKKEVRFKNDFALRSELATALAAALEASAQDKLRTLKPAQDIRFEYIESSPDSVLEIQRFLRKPNAIASQANTLPSLSKNAYIHTLNPRAIADLNPALQAPQEQAFPWTFLGHLEGPYALFKNQQELIIFNSKLAQQRIEYERLLAEFERPPLASQVLLLPLVLTLSPSQYRQFQAHESVLKDLGFEAEPFGKSECKLNATPTWLDAGKATVFFLDSLDLFEQESAASMKDHPSLLKKLAKMAAQRVSSTYQSQAQLTELAKTLLCCQKPLACPRGFPTLFTVKFTDLDKKFSSPSPSLVSLWQG